MKKNIVLLLILLFMTSCDTGTFNNRNPYLPNYPVNEQINLSLPQYSNLQFVSNHVVISAGVRGIVIFNTGSGYVAFDMACPNQDLAACSTMTISGVNAVCPCDDAEYSLFNGQSAGMQYPLKQYRTDTDGGYLYITN
jgi:nitrite reductase/ring-hydroxylating ferredoxin subunit